MLDDPFEGYISTEFTVWCGKCGHWNQISGRKTVAIKEWKRMGWKRFKAPIGWVCPTCNKVTS